MTLNANATRRPSASGLHGHGRRRRDADCDALAAMVGVTPLKRHATQLSAWTPCWISRTATRPRRATDYGRQRRPQTVTPATSRRSTSSTRACDGVNYQTLIGPLTGATQSVSRDRDGVSYRNHAALIQWFLSLSDGATTAYTAARGWIDYARLGALSAGGYVNYVEPGRAVLISPGNLTAACGEGGIRPAGEPAQRDLSSTDRWHGPVAGTPAIRQRTPHGIGEPGTLFLGCRARWFVAGASIQLCGDFRQSQKQAADLLVFLSGKRTVPSSQAAICGRRDMERGSFLLRNSRVAGRGCDRMAGTQSANAADNAQLAGWSNNFTHNSRGLERRSGPWYRSGGMWRADGLQDYWTSTKRGEATGRTSSIGRRCRDGNGGGFWNNSSSFAAPLWPRQHG